MENEYLTAWRYLDQVHSAGSKAQSVAQHGCSIEGSAKVTLRKVKSKFGDGGYDSHREHACLLEVVVCRGVLTF